MGKGTVIFTWHNLHIASSFSQNHIHRQIESIPIDTYIRCIYASCSSQYITVTIINYSRYLLALIRIFSLRN